MDTQDNSVQFAEWLGVNGWKHLTPKVSNLWIRQVNKGFWDIFPKLERSNTETLYRIFLNQDIHEKELIHS